MVERAVGRSSSRQPAMDGSSREAHEETKRGSLVELWGEEGW